MSSFSWRTAERVIRAEAVHCDWRALVALFALVERLALTIAKSAHTQRAELDGGVAKRDSRRSPFFI